MKLDITEGVELDYLAQELMQGSAFTESPLEPERTALLIIDMQYLDASRDYGLGRLACEAGLAERFEYRFARIDHIVPRIARLVNELRALGVMIVYVRVAHTEGAPPRDGAILLCHEGDREAAILDELDREPGDIVLSKTSVSAWTSTEIHSLLRERGVDTVVGCGIVTSGCVELTMRDAVDHGFRGVVVEDCCGANTDDAHQSALLRMSRGPMRVVSSDGLSAEMREAATQRGVVAE